MQLFEGMSIKMSPKISKIRIDQWLVENHLTESRKKTHFAQALIIAKKIFLGNQPIRKADYLIEKKMLKF